MGLIPLMKTPATRRGSRGEDGPTPRVPRDRFIGEKEVRLADGTLKRCRIHGVDAAVCLAETDHRGNTVFIQLECLRRYRRRTAAGYTWTNACRIPDAFGGGGTCTSGWTRPSRTSRSGS
jgi:hypothetical protein